MPRCGRPHGWSVLSRSSRQLQRESLSGFDFLGRELVYCELPYVLSTRRGPRRYRFDCTDDDHVELLGILKSLPCQLQVSRERLGHGNPYPPMGLPDVASSCMDPADTLSGCVPASAPAAPPPSAALRTTVATARSSVALRTTVVTGAQGCLGVPRNARPFPAGPWRPVPVASKGDAERD